MAGNLFGNTLFYGDNLDILRAHVDDASIDLIYLDPPFNAKQAYNMFYRHEDGTIGSAQADAFEDTWRWGAESERTYHDLLRSGGRTADAIEAMRRLLGECDILAYLTMMTPRLVELLRVLKPTGSLYLHCDPTASHYLKILLDAIFGPRNFRNEIVWKRTGSKGLQTRRLPSNHDVLLVYGQGDQVTWNMEAAVVPYDAGALDAKTADKYRHRDSDGRIYRLSDLTNPNPNRPNLTYEFLGVTRVWRWTRERMQEAYDTGLIVQTAPGRVPQMKRYLDEQEGRPLGSVWSDIPPINSQAAERLGYQTQKPLALLERILSLSTRPGDLVLDPFCGCGTTVDAAQKLGRHWTGIDISYLAIDVIDKRMRATYGNSIAATYDILGIPMDVPGAEALAARNKFEFERWAVSLVDAVPNNKQIGDKGIDGVARFATGPKGYGRIIVSVKGGSYTVSHVRDLIGTVQTRHAAMGILVALKNPTKGMKEAAATAGVYQHPSSGRTHPRVQIITIAELLAGRLPDRPAMLMPYVAGDLLVEHTIPARESPISMQPAAAAHG